jgi:predicted transcriptional regulator
LKGIVTLNNARQAAEEKKTISDVMQTDIVQVDQKQLISDLVPLAAQSPIR